ncbi:MAG: hypothetical protein AB8B65_11395 [Kordia sp.]
MLKKVSTIGTILNKQQQNSIIGGLVRKKRKLCAYDEDKDDGSLICKD